MADHAAVAVEAIEQFNHDKLSVVAHSMGAAIGLICAPKLSNLKHFINVEGNLVAQDAGIVSRRTAEQSEASFKERGFDAFLKMLHDSGRPDFASWAAWYERADPLALYKSATSLVKWSDSGKLLEMFNALPSKMYIWR